MKIFYIKWAGPEAISYKFSVILISYLYSPNESSSLNTLYNAPIAKPWQKFCLYHSFHRRMCIVDYLLVIFHGKKNLFLLRTSKIRTSHGNVGKAINHNFPSDVENETIKIAWNRGHISVYCTPSSCSAFFYSLQVHQEKTN